MLGHLGPTGYIGASRGQKEKQFASKSQFRPHQRANIHVVEFEALV